jgi:pyruvate dehydrogenase E2 component (dihydrolipoamide acetyltransferase)
LQSAQEIPQFSISAELDADELAALRSRINTDIEGKESRVSFTALLIWLTAKSLLKHPRLNGRYDKDAILQHDYVNMAVAIDTPQGLTVPVVHRAESLSVSQIAEALKDLVERAGTKRLSPSDFKDTTFTISNLGMLGVTSFTPLINPPQAAIMGVGAPRETVRTGPDGVLVPARTMEVTVTGDHRILDGAEVARFLQTLRDSVKKIFEMDAWKPQDEAKVNTGGKSK